MQSEFKKHKKLKLRTTAAIGISLAISAVTLFVSVYFSRGYYFSSGIIMIMSMLPFFISFETRKPQARELVIIATLSALGVAGRMAFFMVPQFKPVVAIVIISGVCFGAQSGFMVGAVTAFVSNLFFGQGPFTPWQMFALGIIGLLSGILFHNNNLKHNKILLCIFGAVTTFFIYGGLLNLQTAVYATAQLNLKIILSFFIAALPFDAIHTLSTVFFLFVLSNPMIEKLNRIKTKYDFMGT